MNQREFSRVPIALEARVDSQTDSSPVLARTRDLSAKGVYLLCDSRLPVGTDCRVVLLLGEQGELRVEVRGKIVRHEEKGMGAEFTEVGAEGFDHLRNLIRYNTDQPKRVEQEFRDHLGLKRRDPQ